MSLLPGFFALLAVGVCLARMPPLCTEPRAVQGLAEFLADQDMWRTCVDELSPQSTKPSPRMDEFFMLRTTSVRSTGLLASSPIQRAICTLCRERVERTWTGPRCLPVRAPNGTRIDSRDLLHDAFRPYLYLRPDVMTREGVCSIRSTLYSGNYYRFLGHSECVEIGGDFQQFGHNDRIDCLKCLHNTLQFTVTIE